MKVTIVRSSKPGCWILSVKASATKISPFLVHWRGRSARSRPRGRTSGGAAARCPTALLTGCDSTVGGSAARSNSALVRVIPRRNDEGPQCRSVIPRRNAEGSQCRAEIPRELGMTDSATEILRYAQDAAGCAEIPRELGMTDSATEILRSAQDEAGCAEIPRELGMTDSATEILRSAQDEA